nr:cysteine-rich receptor kinase-like protein 2 [Centaurium erythraea]
MALGFREIFLSILCIHVSFLHHTAADFITHCTNDIGNYTRNSTFETNLKTVLSSISSNINTYGFSNSSSGQGVDQVNALALCRGDLNMSACHSCVNDSTHLLPQLCPNQKEAIGWYDECMFRYSSSAILGVVSLEPPLFLPSPIEVPNSNLDLFSQELRSMADQLLSQAYDGSLRKFAAKKSTNPYLRTIYAYMQCTPDIAPGDCSYCLSTASQYLSGCCYHENPGARYQTPSCFFRYEVYPFVNISANQLPPSPSTNVSSDPLPPAPSPGGKGSKSKTAIIVSVVAALVLLPLCVCFFLTRRRWQKAKRGEKLEEDDLEEIRGTEITQYDFATISDSTENFSSANKLGRGGFGDVHKGILSDGKEIAVKRLSRTSGQGEKEFRNEVMLVGKLQHKCLVRLLGFCLYKTERLLIYEFLANGSLDSVLFDSTKRSNLNWERRYQIIENVAKGLLYLHEDSRLRIIHRDLKASNVLLDEEMNAKISDFGMARLFEWDQSEANTNRIAGTYGYMAPEYAMHGLFSVKSDVYSYGVLLVEIISGKRYYSALNGDRVEDLLSFAYERWNDGEAEDLIDPLLKSDSDSTESMTRCIHIALLCVQEDLAIRPTMATVVLMLQGINTSLPRPSEPGFFSTTKTRFDESSSSGSQSNVPLVPHAVNNPSLSELSMSDIDPR